MLLLLLLLCRLSRIVIFCYDDEFDVDEDDD